MDLPVKKRRAEWTAGAEGAAMDYPCPPSCSHCSLCSHARSAPEGTPKRLHVPVPSTASSGPSLPVPPTPHLASGRRDRALPSPHCPQPQSGAQAPDSVAQQQLAGGAFESQAAPLAGSPPAALQPPLPQPYSVLSMSTGRLSDRFGVTGEKLGAGQFGAVMACSDMCTGERLACKSIRKRQEPSASQQAELRNEVGLMMRLQGHENVVQLRGVFEEDRDVHLVLDLCEGGELFDEVIRRHRFSESDGAHLFSEIVKAVAFCHSRGVIHRDLKPENILLARKLPSGKPLREVGASGPIIKLADFGLSAYLAPGQSMRGMAGSPFYMAPEVLKGQYTCKADVWSLGVILYIILCGSPPFWGEKDADVFKAIMDGKIDLTSGPWGAVSAEAKGLIRCLLAKDPSKRPSAQKILTHPWLVRHVAPLRPIRRAARTSTRPVSVQ